MRDLLPQRRPRDQSMLAALFSMVCVASATVTSDHHFLASTFGVLAFDSVVVMVFTTGPRR